MNRQSLKVKVKRKPRQTSKSTSNNVPTSHLLSDDLPEMEELVIPKRSKVCTQLQSSPC